MFNDVKNTLFDVWDNRQLEPLKRYVSELGELIGKDLIAVETQQGSVNHLLRAITSSSSFDDLYSLLGFRYVVQSNGTLQYFEDESFNAIFSYNVLEHVDRAIISQYTQDIYRILKPGGYSIHTIDMGDHLSYYDPTAHKKQYLRFSDTAWKHCFENKVQYFNRIQRSEWLNLFNKTGLDLVEEDSVFNSYNNNIKINRTYDNLDMRDLECVHLRVVH